ncbi:Txe/YoeB family addiction module toxin [Cruoricaptor ignavus]|uniref:Putative mRNA interferase YoeB n=1 Tax=Cruoricaptor ignavus TaxID=1118202 RepID=A0A7M1T3M7_9FLAO|nr:Txe/YoeB family addiction module toxin [Cruoricaptor ignavus]QOR73907.1 Txe/YoeB family addiction module toxin [Cruoricaptor ignavus]
MSFHIEFSQEALDELKFYKDSGNKKLYKKIFDLISSISETPFSGIGKPEPLKNNLSGFWSRRINKEHRIVYKIKNDTIEILSIKGHYTN